MFVENTDLIIKHEVYDDGIFKIKEAGVCDIFDIGGDPACYEPDITSYQEKEYMNYPYSYDYVIMVKKFIVGYFIGTVGYNDCDTIFSKKEDLVYDLKDICMDYIYNENEEPTEYIILFEYLLRQCKNNNYKLLQLKIDDKNRYHLFYSFLKQRFNFQKYNGYLIKKID